ncbi:MAG TPA: HEAT repeat domain-containing protein [Gemmatimonadales bacterium]
MSRSLLVLLVGLSVSQGTPAKHAAVAVHVAVRAAPVRARGVLDVRATIAAAHGVAAPICQYAAGAIRNGNWQWSGDAPVTPLNPSGVTTASDGDEALSTVDVAFLLDSLASHDGCVREMAVRLLPFDEGETAAAGLLQRLTAADSSLREMAAFGLGLVAPERAVEPLMRVLRDASVGVRADAAWALGRIGSGSALRALLGTFDDPAPVVRLSGVVAVGHMDSAAAVPALIKRLRIDESPAVRRTAAWALGQLGEDHGAIAALSEALHGDKDIDVREMCGWALGEIGNKDGTPSLLAALRDPSPRIRETSAWALAEIGDDANGATLDRMLVTEHDSRVRATLAWALGQLDATATGPGLLAAVSDSSAGVRMRAAWAISQHGDKAAIPALRTALAREKDSDAARAEIRALIHSVDDPSELASLLESKDASVRVAVTRALAGRRGPDPWPWPNPRPRPFP